MFAIRQIIENPQDTLPIPPELRHRRTEVIFIALDSPTEQASSPFATDAVAAFRGKGQGGSVGRLLLDRQADRAQEA